MYVGSRKSKTSGLLEWVVLVSRGDEIGETGANGVLTLGDGARQSLRGTARHASMFLCVQQLL